jgi:catechol 2,3-dioxygenase-like lactoylglutathione lyase family enzyme
MPALNHVGLWVDDLESAVHWMQGQGKKKFRFNRAGG